MVYVDGFNFYYGQLKGTPHKWVDLQALFGRVLSAQNKVVGIKYFTAKVQPTLANPSVMTRQDAYLKALGAHCPLVHVGFGHFLRHRIRMEERRPATRHGAGLEERGEGLRRKPRPAPAERRVAGCL
ncbi:hypothetical protein [Ramlibacter henchirensis]|uniref:hypothetical protein n=1 Tax=Ramlibacter henchirensis TaxID=204072 RepID=UPI001F11539B|nr:hypothetical protein [Ramlibacter henchirensis]